MFERVLNMPLKFPGKYFHMTHGRSTQPDMFHERTVLKVFKKCTYNEEKRLQPRYFPMKCAKFFQGILDFSETSMDGCF